MLTFNSVAFSATPEYKVGDNCKDIDPIDYPEGLWCGQGNEGNFYFSEIPFQLDDSQVAILTEDIEALDCTNVKTWIDCENLGRISAIETMINKFELTKKQAEIILSCYKFDAGDAPPDFVNFDFEIRNAPLEFGRVRLCYYYKYPKESAAERFNNLDGGAKSSIIFFIGAAILLFILFFTAQNKEKGAANLTSRLVKTVLAVCGFALIIVFGVWLFVVVIEPLFSGTKIDLSKKIFGIPQYMLMILNAVYFIAWNSNKKK